MIRARITVKLATIAGPASNDVPGGSVPFVGCVVVSVGVELVEVVDETINHRVSEWPLLHVAVVVRLSLTTDGTRKVSYMPQLYD